MIHRTSFAQAALGAFLLWSALTPLSAGAAPVRTPIHAVDPLQDRVRPYVSVRVGSETRDVLVPSGRYRLALRPGYVGAGGRVFVFAKVPVAYEPLAFEAEMLLWIDGRWQRRRTLYKEAGRVGHVAATIVDDELEKGPIATAVYARTAFPGRDRIDATMAVDVPPAAHLDFGFSLDEADWGGLAPVVVSVSAVVLDGDMPSGRRVALFERLIVPGKQPPKWFDARADLASLAGERVRFVFSSVPREAGSQLAPHVVWSAPTLVVRESAPRPAVVIVSLDGVRARSMSCCGESRSVTPFLDRLFGEQGIVFERALAQSVETIPSHMTLLTGLYPSVHGIGGADRRLGADADTLAELLARAGYATAAFTDGAGLTAEGGFQRGFATYGEDFRIHLRDVDGWADHTFERALAWIERHRGEPFFVFVHTSEALPPYVPPRDYLGLFKDQRLEGVGPVDEGSLVRYEREIRYLDDAMKRFVTGLDRLSDSAGTFLIVTSGHGEEFLEHGAREAGTHLYEESIRVPLLMRGPGLRAGRRYSAPVGLIDVAPTVLDLVGIAPPVEMQGRSVAKALRSGLPYSLPRRFSEASGLVRKGVDGIDQAWRPPAYAVSDSTHKLIMYDTDKEKPTLEAYDLVADPQETNDLYSTGPAAPAWIAKLERALESYPTACRQVARPTESVPLFPIASRLKLQAYGYLTGARGE